MNSEYWAEYGAFRRDRQRYAGKLRKQMTLSERKAALYLCPLGFRTQVPLFGYIADFAHREKRIIVEMDGHTHFGREAYDKQRDDVFRSHGWQVFRFRNHMILKDPLSIQKTIREALA